MNYSDSALFADSGAFDANFFKFSDNSGLTSGITPSSSLEDDSAFQRRKEAHLFLDSEIEESKSQFNLTENPDFHKISKNFRSDGGIVDRGGFSRLIQKSENISSIVAGLPPLVVGHGNSNRSSSGNSPTASLSSQSQPLYQRGSSSRSPSNYGSNQGMDNDFLRGPSSMLQDSYGRPQGSMQQNGYQNQMQMNHQMGQSQYSSGFAAYGPGSIHQQQQYQQQQQQYGPGSGLYGSNGYDEQQQYYNSNNNRAMKFSPKVYPSMTSPSNASYLNLVNSVEERDKDVYVVEFKKSSKEFVLGYRAPASIAVGDAVIVSADRGEDLGVVTHIFPMKEFLYRKSMMSQQMGGNEFDKSMGRILRLATSSEIMMLSKKVYDENEVVEYTRELVHNVYRLDLRIVDAEYQFDRHKLTIYYDANYRIDFRDLVKALYSTFKARIWMEHAGGVLM